MDDGDQPGSCLLDVINDPKLLESFLENGPAANSNCETRPSDSRPAITSTAKSKKPSAPRKAAVNGKKNQSSSDAKQSCHVSSSSAGSKRTSIKNEEKGATQVMMATVPGSSPNISMQPNQPFQTLSMAGGTQMIRTSLNPQTNLCWPQLQVRPPGGQPMMQASGGMLQMINGQLVMTRGSSVPNIGPSNGGLLQLIQTPNGPQLVSFQPSPNCPTVQQAPLTTTPTKSAVGSSSAGGRSGNKQILPKPSSTSNSTKQSSHNNQPNTSQASPMRSVVGGLNQVPQSLTINPSGDGSPQIILGSGGGTAPSFIQGPNGTILLNHMGLQGLNQPFLLQGTGGMGPVQLTLRPSGPQLMAVSSAGQTLTTGGTQLLSALSSPAITSQSSSSLQTRGLNTQTMMFPNQSQSGLSISGSPRGGQNQIILTRPGAPFGQQSILQSAPVASSPQFIQIQTPNGPMLVALQPPSGLQSATSQTVFSSAPQTPGTFSFSNSLLQSSLHSGQTIISQNSQDASSPSIILSQQNGQQNLDQISQQNNSKAKSVNLADLLKETGILPESSPPTSPSGGHQTRLTPQIHDNDQVNQQQHQDTRTTVLQSQPQTLFMVPSGVSNQQQNILLTQNALNGPTTPQLRLALAPDGSVVLQQTHVQSIPSQILTENVPMVSKAADNLKDACGPGSSQPSPDSTTPTFDAALPTPPTSASTKSEQPVSKSSEVKIKTERKDESANDVTIPAPVEKINSTNDIHGIQSNEDSNSHLSTPVIKIKPPQVPCDNENLPESRIAPEVSSGGVQISLSDQDFREKVESQIKEMKAAESLRPDQQKTLSDLQSLLKTFSDANKVSHTESPKIFLTTQVPNNCSESAVSQSNTQATSVQLVNILKPTNVVPNHAQIRLFPQPTVTTPVSGTTTFQVGTQLITISGTPTKQSPAPLPSQVIILSKVTALFELYISVTDSDSALLDPSGQNTANAVHIDGCDGYNSYIFQTVY